MFLSAFSQQFPDILSIFLIYQLTDVLLTYLPSLLFFTKGTLKFDSRRKWSRRTISLLHSCIVTINVISIFSDLKTSGLFDSPAGRVLANIKECSGLQSLMLGYELWEALAISLHPGAFPIGSWAHCVINIVVWLVTMRPTAKYYIPGFILCQSSSIFLELHWMLEQFGMQFSIIGRCNNALFLLCFTIVRLGYFPVHALRMVMDGFVMWKSHDRVIFPHWLMAIYVVLPLSLGLLNVFWFARIIQSGRFDISRDQAGNQDQDAATTESNIEELREAWASTLQKKSSDIKNDDDFFRIGGDSIAALQMQDAARNRGINLTVKTIITSPTLSDMAKAGTTDLGHYTTAVKPFACLGLLSWPVRLKAASICGVDTRSIEDIYPCATFQAVQMALGANHKDRFRLRASYHTTSELDMPRFQRAFELLSTSNPILRTRIVKIREAYLQVVLNESIEWRVYDHMDDYMAENKSLHMSFGRPLTHYAMVSNGNNKPPTFIWMIHHALFDGWSFQLLMKDLSRLYEGLNPTRFHPFSKVMYDWHRSDSSATVEYWSSELRGATPTHFTGVPAAYIGTTNARVTKQIPRVEAAVQYSHIKLATIVRSSWALVLSELVGGHSDICFGLIVSGRNAPTDNIQRTVGPTMSTVPIRTQLRGEQSLQEYMTTTHQQDIGMLPHEQFPIAQLRAQHPEALRAFSSHSSVIIHPRGRAYRDLPGVLGKLGTVEVHRMGFSKPAVLECFLESDYIGFCLHYDSAALEGKCMERALGQIGVAVDKLATMPSTLSIHDMRDTLKSVE